MPRPSLKAQRQDAILDAVGHCIVQYGVGGTTLEKLAETAGMSRSLLRHNIGNRDAILAAFLDRFFSESEREVEAMLAMLPEHNAMPVLLDMLFDGEGNQTTLVALSLTAAAASDEPIRRRLSQWNQAFADTLTELLQSAYPKQTRQAVEPVAAGVMGIYFNAESLTALHGMQALRRASKQAAHQLIQTLES
ncbi:TetR/AcrR family transcriptional regulator [Ferrimonas marina]|uniref:DNA-binding transcriptional regulator, AcrR family n=1 Tax=Ferrimonas marina TaxID=299255 RepID=A0A1M5Z518_9GAMM|nr:TetR/AcrR family transcriptional regulator [Ferrimonas marina]SHI19367.1 DNA-binding transcriptional regulator, AcrR family [Ferrimonas marina]